MGVQMTDEANLRPEGSLAVWTGNGGSCRPPVGTVVNTYTIIIHTRFVSGFSQLGHKTNFSMNESRIS